MNRAFHVGGMVLLLVCAGVLTGTVASAAVFVVGLVLLCVLIGIGKAWELPLWCYAAATALCLSGLFLWVRGYLQPDYAAYTKNPHTFCGIVTEQNRFDTYQALELQLTEGSPAPLVGKPFTLHTGTAADILSGEIIRFVTTPSPADLSALQGGGSVLTGYVFMEPEVIGENQDHWRVRLELLRRRISSGLYRLLPTEEGGILGALVTGKMDKVPPQTRELYRQGGMSHFLSMSGQHLTVLLMLLGCIGETVIPHKRLRLWLELCAALGLTALSGFAPSMLRAAFMAMVGRTGMLLGRRSDGLNALGVSAVILLLYNPTLSCSISFLLSYLATMGILGFHQPFTRLLSMPFGGALELRETKPLLASVVSVAAITPAALVLTTPLTGWFFGEINPVGLLTNPLANLPMMGALFFTMVAAIILFVPFGGSLATAFAFGAALCLRLIQWIAQLGQMLPIPHTATDATSILLWELGALGCIWLLWYLRREARIIGLGAGLSACSLVTILLLSPALWHPPLKIIVPQYDDYVLVQYGTQAAVVGTPKNVQSSERLAEGLSSQKIENLELLVVEQDKHLLSGAGKLLGEHLPAKHLVVLENEASFEGVLFGDVRVYGDKSRGVWIEYGGVRTAKTFQQKWTPAHVLINQRGEVIADENLPLSIHKTQSETVLALYVE